MKRSPTRWGFRFFMVAASPNLYETLGVPSSAKPDALRKAYRKLARERHPDVSKDPKAHDQMSQINEAFNTLIDPERRADYDAMLAGRGYGEPAAPQQERKPIYVKLKTHLKAHRTPVYSVGFAPDTGQLVSSSFDSEIIWWDDTTEKPVRRTRLEASVSTIRVLPNERLVAAGSVENTVTLFELDKGEVGSWKSSEEAWVSCLAISGDGRAVATGSIHKSLAVADSRSGLKLFRRMEHGESVTAVAWSTDGKLLATGSADATARVYNNDGDLVREITRIRSAVTAIVFSPNKQFLAVAAVDLSIRIFSLDTGQLVKMMFGHTKPIETLAFHPNNWLLASGSRDGTLGLWNCAKGLGNVRLEASHRPISCLAFSDDGVKLAAGGLDRLIRVWEITVRESAA
jgi:WD40 repeat protein